MKMRIEVECVYSYYGWPQAQKTFLIGNNMCRIEITHYGNQGWGFPTIVSSSKDVNRINGFFWTLEPMMVCIYKDGGFDGKRLTSMKQGDKETFDI